jgi:surface polysaccharide O-acyltransferase-like enzyme
MSHRTSAALPASSSSHASSAAARSDGLAWVSWLRVVAIAAVVLIHVAGMTAVAPDARSTSQGELGILLDFVSRWSVPVFVMLSGALLLDPRRYRGHRDFLRRRALRLVPAVIVWHLVYLVYIVAFTGQAMSMHDVLERVLTGKLWTALYFFWIVIGLAVITPVLVPWIAVASRRAQLLVGLGAAALPALTVVTVPIRTDALWSADVSWVQTPWTWWIPYLGYYLLGYALRDVVLKSWRLALAAAAAIGCSVLLVWQWGQSTGAGGVLERYLPAEAYYSPTLILLAISVFLLARALIRPGGLLGVLSRRGPALAGRRLGDSTLGVFAVHLLVLQAVLHLPVIGGDDAASSFVQLLARCVTVFVVAYLIALVASRLPLVRRVF